MNNAVLIMLFVALFVAIAVAVIVALTRKGGGAVLNKEEYQAKWLAIERSITKDEASWHLAIMNADKLLDRALRARRFKGKTMGERMKAAKNVFSDRNGIWTAHKLRNQIAHEEVRVTAAQTKQAMKAFKTALRDMGAM